MSFGLATFLLALLVLGAAGSVTIDGSTLTNCGSGNEGVNGVIVTLSSGSSVLDSQTTDSEGYFAFNDVQKGQQVEVAVQAAAGFQPVEPVTLTASTNITLSFQLLPSLSMAAPSDVMMSCPANTDPSNTGTPYVSCVCPVSVVFSDTVSGDSCSQLTTRTWTATSSDGNSASAVQWITVVDDTPPVLSVPPDVVLECGTSTSPANTGGATATDACTSAVLSYADTVTVSGCSTVDARTWVATDTCGNTSTGVQVIQTVDTTTPVFVVAPSAYNGTCSDSSEEWYDSFAYSVVSDSCSPVTLSMVLQGSCSGYATVSAADDCGNFVSMQTTFATQSPNPNDPDDCNTCWFG